MLTLLGAILVAGVWNMTTDLIGNAHFRDNSTANFYQQLEYSCYDYIAKPLLWIMPLGSVVASVLGWWVGRRAAGDPS